MAVAIAAATVGSFLNFGLPKLHNVAYKDVQDDVRSISRHLSYIHASFLDEFKPGVATTKVKDEWLTDMNLLSYDIEDVIDCFKSNFTPRERHSEVKRGILPRVLRYSMRMMIPSSKKIADKIRDLEKRSSIAKERFNRFMDDKAAPTAPTKEATATREEVAPQESKEEELLQLVLRTPSELEKKLTVISIIGYSAAGNTLLVDTVCSNQKVQNQFPRSTRYNAVGKEVGLVIENIKNQLTLNQNGGNISSNMDSTITEHQEIESTSTSINVMEHQAIESTSINDHTSTGVETGSRLGWPWPGPWPWSYLASFETIYYCLTFFCTVWPKGLAKSWLRHNANKSVMVDQKTESSSVKDLEGESTIIDQETESTYLATIPSDSSQDEDGRYLLVIDNVDMDKLMAIVNNFNNVEGGIIIVVTTDYTNAMHCKCAPLDLDNQDDPKYLSISELTTTIFQEKAAFVEETRRNEQKLQDVLVDNYKKSICTLHFEHCLLYFCMFPCHHLVRWNLLSRRYLAEGISFDVQEEEPQGKPITAWACLEKFIDDHAVQHIQLRKNGEVKGCQFPVMMLNHISGESKYKKFLTLFCRSTPTTTKGSYPEEYVPVRRLSIHPISAQNSTLSLPDETAVSHLRTLAVFHTGRIDKIEELYKYELLRVLDLKACTALSNKDLEKICNLLLLKYLSLGDNINEVPRDIAKLEWLDTLAMTKTQIVQVPVEAIELPEIKHLLGKFQLYKQDIKKRKMKKLLSTKREKSKLERLSGFVIVDGKEFLDLMRFMVNLKKVKIWCDAAKWTPDVTAGIKYFIGNDPSKNLSLSIECKNCPQEIVTCLQHPGTLASLKLRGNLKPETHLGVQVDRPIIQGLKLKGIKVLCLSRTNLSGVEIVPILKFFLALEYLKLVEDHLGSLEIPAGCLNTLGRLCLVAVNTLEGIIIREPRVLPCLVSLHMLFQTQGDLSGIDINQLQNLKEIGLYSDVNRKDYWQAQASQHEKRPKVLLIQRLISSVQRSPA